MQYYISKVEKFNINANFYYSAVSSSLIPFQYDQKIINNKTLFSHDKHTHYIHKHSRKRGERKKNTIIIINYSLQSSKRNRNKEKKRTTKFKHDVKKCKQKKHFNRTFLS
jgi:hypothetical protein